MLLYCSFLEEVEIPAQSKPRHEVLGFGSHLYCLPVVLPIAHSNDHLAEG